MSMERLEAPGGEIILRFEGGFGAAEAWKAHQALEGAGRACPVVLDFSRVRSFEDSAIAVVAPDLVSDGGPPIRIRGLGMHQRRILEYFGVKGPVLDERARPDAEPAQGW
jgi:hypothetical protein